MVTAPKYEMRFGSADRLTGFANVRFFTPALLYLFAPFSDIPLCDFLAGMPEGTRLMTHRFEKAIFTKFNGAEDWNHYLWGIGAEYYAAFENFLLSVTLYSPAHKEVMRIGAQDITIVDPQWADQQHIYNPLAAPLLPIVVFGIDGSRGCVATATPLDCRFDRPTVVRYPAQPRTQQFADVLFDGGNPSNVLELPPLPVKPPVTLRTQDIDLVEETKRAEYQDAIRRYKKEFGK